MNLNKILIFFLFASFAWGELQRLPGLPLYFHDLVLAALLLVNRRRLKLYRPLKWFIAAALISLVLAGFRLPFYQVLTGSLYLVRLAVYSLLINLKIKPVFLIGAGSAIAGLGLAQYFLVPDTRFLLTLNWDEHYFRLLSTLLDPNFTGIILVLGLVLVYFYYQKNWWLYLIYLPALLLTYSRSSYLALFAAVVAIAVLKRKFIYILFILIFLLTLFFLPRPGGEGVKLERMMSIKQRWSNYQLGRDLWRRRPLFGLGFNTLRYYRDNQLSHSASGLDSSLLLVLVTTGAAGFLAYGHVLISLWQKGPVIKVTLAALLIHSLFVNSLFYSLTMIWLWSVVDG